LKFNLGILIFGLGTKVTIFYFHFSPYDTSYVMSSENMCHIITQQNYLTSGTKVITEV